MKKGSSQSGKQNQKQKTFQIKNDNLSSKQQIQLTKDTTQNLINAPYRKLIIEQALKRLKNKNLRYLQDFQTQRTWKKIQQSYAILNIPTNFQKLMKFTLCQVQQKQQTFFNPFQKIPIRMCYNKIGQQTKFKKLLIYNLILLHDSKAKKNIDWNNINHAIKANIRALNISQICRKDDIKCFKKEIQSRVTNRQRFQGIQYNFQKLYNQAIQDYSPLSQSVFNSQF